MKRVVSISLGSSARDHSARVTILGEEFLIERIGTDGDMNKAIRMIRDLDGKVDAFGMGGIDLYIWCKNRRWAFRDAKKIAQAAKKTPIVDGSGLKNTLERRVVQYIVDHNVVPLKGRNVLLVSGVDRFGMAESLEAAGSNLIIGDLIFALKIPIPMRSIRTLDIVARIFAPMVVQLPFKMLYPTGEKQNDTTPKYKKYYDWADLVAGDYHFIRRYMPPRMDGKAVLTNTVTESDVRDLKARGVHTLITTTPEINGRSFGTNVMEGILVALAGKPPEEIRPQDYLELLDRIGF
ncbi:MAG TPA: quinate 5-dehydrogenase, partial [Clostridia bacterium]|nr:quinate 5-dehydrogenase [Clostridia bacterium]